MTKLLIGALGALLIAISPGFAQSSKAVAARAENADRMTQKSIYDMYRNRTWDWGRNGAGNFAVKKRKFAAWTRNKSGLGYGEGIWFIPRDGKLCFRARWTEPGSSTKAQTCFEHRTDGGVLYQRRLPDGDWYVFKHRRARKSDEFHKLRNGDRVSRRVEAIRSRLEPGVN